MKGAGKLLLVMFALHAREIASEEMDLGQGDLASMSKSILDMMGDEVQTIIKSEVQAQIKTMHSDLEKISEGIDDLKAARMERERIMDSTSQQIDTAVRRIKELEDDAEEDSSFDHEEVLTNIVHLMKYVSYYPGVSLLQKLADAQFESGNHVLALFLNYVSAMMDPSAGNDNVHNKGVFMGRMKNIVLSLSPDSDAFKVMKKFAIPLMKELLESIRGKEGATSAKIAENEAWGHYQISICYHHFGDTANFASDTKDCVDIMEAEFRQRAFDYRIYAHCVYNTAAIYRAQGQFVKALKCYRRALRAYNSATDIDKDEQKSSVAKLRETIPNMKFFASLLPDY